jgi:hypothetical protein
VVANAVPDLSHLNVYVADTVHVLLPQQTTHIGGIVRSIDQKAGTVLIYSRTDNLMHAIEIKPNTRVTLSKWAAGYGDMAVGDHVTVSGIVDNLSVGVGPNPLVAKRVRLSSPSFRGIITAIVPGPDGLGEVMLTVSARRGHILHIIAPGFTPVQYGQQSARVFDLRVGQNVAARGTRSGKFDLDATLVQVYPHNHTIGGTVRRVLPGSLRIYSSAKRREFIVHFTAGTSFSAGGKPATMDGITVGTRIRARGYDLLRGDPHGLPILDATRISILSPAHHARARVHHVRATKRPPSRAQRPAVAATATQQPQSTPSAAATRVIAKGRR